MPKCASSPWMPQKSTSTPARAGECRRFAFCTLVLLRLLRSRAAASPPLAVRFGANVVLRAVSLLAMLRSHAQGVARGGRG